MMFKAGDVVQLKSGGPLMTVTGISDIRKDSELLCQRVWVVWFDAHDKLCSDELKSTTLEKAE